MKNKLGYTLAALLLVLFPCSHLVGKESAKARANKSNKEMADLKKRVEALENEQRNRIQELARSIDHHRHEIENHQASIHNSENLQSILVRYGNNPQGMAPLHYAIEQEDIYGVNLLLAHGAHANAKDFNQAHTALTFASSRNQIEIVRILLDSGADINLSANEESYYPLGCAAKTGSAALIRLLVEHGARLDGVNEKKTSKYPTTPLHIACEAGNFEAIVELLKNRAKIDGGINLQFKEPSLLTWREGTPLDWAICKLTYKDNPQNLDIIKYLVENGATRRVIHLYHHGATDYKYCPVISEYLKSMGIPES